VDGEEIVCCKDADVTSVEDSCIPAGDKKRCPYGYPAAFCRLCISKQSLQTQDRIEKTALIISILSAALALVSIVVSIALAIWSARKMKANLRVVKPSGP
jgi:hypothetical protein